MYKVEKALRRATMEDWKILLDWRNEPLTRQNSFQSEIINEDDHKEWLSKSLANPDREIYILEGDNGPLGTIRSDKVRNGSKDCKLSWSTSPEFRGKGYGTLMLKMFLQFRKGKYLACIKADNLASISMVEKNHFTLITSDSSDQHVYYRDNTISDFEIIDEIEKVRSRNNVNWMDILRIGFTYAPEETREVFKKITSDDNLINELSKQLANNG